MQRGEYSLAAFLDIEGAFNKVKSSSITKALEEVRFNYIELLKPLSNIRHGKTDNPTYVEQ